jgi:tetratricopeptide (TPR) repeat protein
MARSTQPITFLVPGQDRARAATATRGEAGSLPLPLGLTQGRVQHSVTLGAQRGGAAVAPLRVQAVPGRDVVVLHLANGPSLMLSPENARLLMLAQGGQTRPATKATRGAQPGPNAADDDAPDSVAVPVQLQWRGLEAAQAATRGAGGAGGARGATRGLLGQVLLKGLDVVTGLVTDKLTERATDFLTSQAVQRVDGQVAAGVYALKAESLAALKGQPIVASVPAAANDGPLLVLIHGTFSTTAGSFGQLWGEHPDKVRALFTRYAGRVYGLDHPTLGMSPIANALTLVQALPPGAVMHLLTHSRGGLVAEVLARVCGTQGTLDAEQLKLFDGAAYDADRQALQTLADLVAQRGIIVERVVRVACPARGTLLASKRLDAYLSVLKWALELANVPVAPALLGLLADVALRRADPGELPGLAAMMPASPLVQWLHAADAPLPGELRVVAGDLAGDSVVSWVKTLLADSFFWCDNDLVVHTSSMYGGAPRESQASFVLDQGGKVSHFNYFSNERTAAAVVAALVQPSAGPAPAGFQPIGPLSAQGLSSTGVRGASRGAASPAVPQPDKPAVFMLPGILGSNLAKDGHRIWLGWRIIGGLKQLAYDPAAPDGVTPDGPMGLSYDKLCTYLQATHEVIEFGYDWRKPLEQEAQRLATAVEAALAARAATGQPVRLLAHSMGGLLARTMQLEKPDTWARLMARPGGRLLMLGTPNGGSWAPMQVLSGDDTFGNTLVAFGAPFQDHSARMLMATFPGFIQLQAGLVDDPRGLDKAETWQQLAEKDLATVEQHNWWHSGDEAQLNAYRWGAPPQAVLDQAVALRKRLDAQRDRDLPPFTDRMLLVVGQARFTPDGYQFTDEGLVYLDAPQAGDGRVTLDSARLPGVRTWQLGCAHGDLPTEADAFPALLALLQQGDTQALPRLPDLVATVARAASDGAPASPAAQALRGHVPHRPSRTPRLAGPPTDLDDAWRALPVAPNDAASPLAASPALRVEVLNSDLGFVGEPLLLGHYRALALTGTEAVVNRLVGGALQTSLGAGLYPDAPGSQQIFLNTQRAPDNPWRLPRPAAVVVVGLGEEGKLSATDLCRTVRQGVIAWGQRVAEQGGAGTAGGQGLPDGLMPAQTTLAATLIGSGGSGITVGQSAQQVAQGVREANERLRAAGWPVVGTLVLIELYLDRASEAWRALQGLAESAPGRFDVAGAVRFGQGALRRPADYGYRGANYDYVSALPDRDAQGGSAIAYTLNTRRARTELRAQATQLKLVTDLVLHAATHDNGDAQLGRTLFQLLVPPELEGELGSAQALVMELAPGSAGIPWELLDTRPDGGPDASPDPTLTVAQLPWALRTRLLRKLRLDNFRTQVLDAHPTDAVLVIGEPQCDHTVYPELPGARAEAAAVAASLTAPLCLPTEQVQLLTQPDAREVITTLLSRDWRMVHIAGHGEPPSDQNPGGVVLMDGTFLGPREIQTMRVVPELVFVNCCHLGLIGGAGSPGELLQPQTLAAPPPRNQAAFAAGVAEALMRIGVRCVVAAGWAVDDEPAALFATTFYRAVLQGQRFIDAVAAARLAAWGDGQQGNTWGAYQCYGDPDWVLRREGADAQRPATPLGEEFAGIASPSALTLALERIATGLNFQGAEVQAQRDKISHLDARFAPLWGGMGAVAEAFGVAWSAAGDIDAAIAWYQRAAQANDGSASLKAVEQLGNLRVRSAWAAVKHAAPGEVAQAAATALPLIEGACAQLEQLLALQPTAERASLCGSARKRLSIALRLQGDSGSVAAAAALAASQGHYRQAFDLARAAGDPTLHYPGLNLLTAEWLTAGHLDPDHLAAVTQSLDAAVRNAPDFWCVAGQTELRLLQALDADTLDAACAARLQAEFADLHGRVAAPLMWESVFDQTGWVLATGASGRKGAALEAARALVETLAGYAAGALVG